MTSAALHGRVALVTGCLGGIGRKTCCRLAEAGAQVIGTDIAPIEAADDWRMEVPGAEYRRLDVTDEEGWAALAAEIEARYGMLHIAVHLAGIVLVQSIAQTMLSDWRRVYDINVTGPFLGVRATEQLMQRAGETLPFGASIVMVSSVAAMSGAPLHAAYCASKGAVRSLAKAVAMEFSAAGHAIRVNSVHPGGVETPMLASIRQSRVDQGMFQSTDRAAEATRLAHPIGRIAQPDEIAKTIRFLASDDAGYMHGSELVVDGGLLAR
jgi:NAD(P)-dependent dehydrogenase (short-subunit alcohol dehydrogenase family)